MANTSRVNGFKPVKHITGAPYNGQANIYEVPAAAPTPTLRPILATATEASASDS